MLSNLISSHQTFFWIAVFSLSSAVVNALGIFAIFKHEAWAEKVKTYFMCFAAGVLISTPLILSLPKAIEKNHLAGAFSLLGFLFMLFSNKIIAKYTKEKSLAFGITAAEGIGIHSFVDGIIYSVTFQASILIGVVAGLGLVIHEFAEGVITYTVLIKSGIKGKTARFYAFVIAALTTPIGAFIAYPLVSKLNSSTLGLILGFTTGVLIYVSASHLLPTAKEEHKKHSLIAFLAGVALALLIVFTKS